MICFCDGACGGTCADMFKNGVSPSCVLTLWMLFAAEEKLSGKVAGANMVPVMGEGFVGGLTSV